MAKISSVDIKLLISTTQGGAASTDISTQVQSWNGLPIEMLTEEGHGYSHAWVFHESVKMRQMGDITISVFFDAAGGTAWTILNTAQTASEHRKFRVELGGSGAPYKSADVWVATNNTTGDRGALIKSEFTLRLASTVTEGTV